MAPKAVPIVKTPDQQILSALAAAQNAKSNLIKFSELPTAWQYNAHIFEGYRFTDSRVDCLRSIFRIHNETFNIWSHLLGCIFLIHTLLYDGPKLGKMPKVEDGKEETILLLTSVYYFYLVAAVVCTACSVSWHTMRCISSHSTMSCFSSADLMGVTTLVIASTLVTQFTAFEDTAFWLHTYMGASLLLGAAALTACWLPIMMRPEASWARVGIWISLVAHGLIMPFVHIFFSKGLQKAVEVYAPIMPAYGPILFSAVIYASQFPECCWPGRFDWLGSSHNIHHVLSMWAIWLGVKALRNMYSEIGIIV